MKVVKKIKPKINFNQKNYYIASVDCPTDKAKPKWKPVKKLTFTLPLMHAL